MESIFAKLVRLLKEGGYVEESFEVKPESTLKDLELDSLDQVELLMNIEEEFKFEGQSIEIADEEAEKCNTVQDLVTLIEGKLFKE